MRLTPIPHELCFLPEPEQRGEHLGEIVHREGIEVGFDQQERCLNLRRAEERAGPHIAGRVSPGCRAEREVRAGDHFVRASAFGGEDLVWKQIRHEIAAAVVRQKAPRAEAGDARFEAVGLGEHRKCAPAALADAPYSDAIRIRISGRDQRIQRRQDEIPPVPQRAGIVADLVLRGLGHEQNISHAGQQLGGHRMVSAAPWLHR